MCINDFRTYINTDTTFSAVSHPQRPNTASANVSIYGPVSSPLGGISFPLGKHSPSTFEVDEEVSMFNSFGLQELLPSLQNYMWTGSCGWQHASMSITFKDGGLGGNSLHDGVGFRIYAGESSSIQSENFIVSNSFTNATPLASAMTFDGGANGLGTAGSKARNLAAAITSSTIGNGISGLISCSISTFAATDDTVELYQVHPGLHGNTCLDYVEEETLKTSVTVSIAPGKPLTDCFVGGDQPGCQCTWAEVEESVQTLDMHNFCVEMNYFFMGSGSYHCDMQGSGSVPTTHDHPTWKVETMDGAVHYVTRDQQFLVWNGGGTLDNYWQSAEDLSPATWTYGQLSGSVPCDGNYGYNWDCATKLVCWQNDVYGYVKVKFSYDDPYPHTQTYNQSQFHPKPAADNGKAVHWMTTGTNSYQLSNRIVVKGWGGELCSCNPNTNIDDIPCNTTKSCCIESSGLAGNLMYTQSMTTTTHSAYSQLSWSIKPHSESTDYQVNWNYPDPLDKRAVDLRLIASNDSNYQICLTEWAPIEQICEPNPESLLPTCPTCGDTEFYKDDITNTLHLATMSSLHFTGQDSYGGWNSLTNTFWDDNFVEVVGSGSMWTIQFLSQSGNVPETESYYQHRYMVLKGSATASTALAPTFESYSSWTPSHESPIGGGYMKNLFATTSFFYRDSAGPGTRFMESLAFSINSSWDNKTDFPGFPVAEYDPIANGFPLGQGHSSQSLYGGGSNTHFEFISLKSTGCVPTSADSPLGNEVPFNPYKMAFSPYMDFRQDSGEYEFHQSGSNANVFWPDSQSYANSGSFCAKNECCFDLIINKQPSWNQSSSVCQYTVGRTLNMTNLFNVIDYDSLIWTGPAGSTLQGQLSAEGEIKIDPYTGLPYPVDQIFIVNENCLISGTASFCFTASVSNSLCWHDASCGYSSSNSIPTGSYSPDCCADVSGCSTVYLNPGVYAGTDQIVCLPSFSLDGTLQAQQPTNPTWPLIGVPTWSNAGGPGVVHFIDSHSFTTDAMVIGGATPNGIYTMSLSVPHGVADDQCIFSDTCYIEVVEQPSSISSSIFQCVTINTDYRTIVYGTPPSAQGYGMWSVVAPDQYTSSAQVVIQSPTKHNTTVVQPFDTLITYEWLLCEPHESSLTDTEDTYSLSPIYCCGSQSVDVLVAGEPNSSTAIPIYSASCPTCDGPQTVYFETQLNPWTTNASYSVNFTSWDEGQLNGTYLAFSSSTAPFTSGTIINSSSNHYLGTDTPLISTLPVEVGNQVLYENVEVPNQATTIYPWQSSQLVFSSSNLAAYGKDIRVDMMYQGGSGICDQSSSFNIQFPAPVDTGSLSFRTGSGFYGWEEPYIVPFDPAQTASAGIFPLAFHQDIVAITFRSGSNDQIPSTQSTVMSKGRNVPAPFLTGSMASCIPSTVEPPVLMVDGHTQSSDGNEAVPTPNTQMGAWAPASSSMWGSPWPTSSNYYTNAKATTTPIPAGGVAAAAVNFEWNARTVAIYGYTASLGGEHATVPLGNYISWENVIDLANQFSGSQATAHNPFGYMYYTQSNGSPTGPVSWITGSFVDTMTSTSFVQSPTFFPALRNITRAVSGWPGLNNDGPIYSDNQGQTDVDLCIADFSYASWYISSMSVMFEVTASYNTNCEQRWYTSQSLMFFNFST